MYIVTASTDFLTMNPFLQLQCSFFSIFYLLENFIQQRELNSPKYYLQQPTNFKQTQNRFKIIYENFSSANFCEKKRRIIVKFKYLSITELSFVRDKFMS
jgi:hypothetical protein